MDASLSGVSGFSDQSSFGDDLFALVAGNGAPASSQDISVAVCSAARGLDGAICEPPGVGVRTRLILAICCDFCRGVPANAMSSLIPAR